jgi:hypothetical protein
MKNFVLLLMLGLLTGGCALGTTRVDITHDALAPIAQKKAGNVVVEPFVDARIEKEFIGNKRNGFGMVVGHIGAPENVKVEELLTKYFAEALTEAGYTVQIAGSQPTTTGAKVDVIVGGEIKEFYLDLYMKTWHYMTVDLKAVEPGTRKVVWEKEVKGEESNMLWLGVTSEFERVIRTSLTKALDQAAKEFAADEFGNLVKK